MIQRPVQGHLCRVDACQQEGLTMSLTDHPAVPIAPRGLGIIKVLKHCSPDKGTAAELTDLHSKSVQVQRNRGTYTLTDSTQMKARHRRHRVECSPNLLKINAPQYQHLVWHVLVISFSPLSVSVLRTADRVCLKRGFPVSPSLAPPFPPLSNPSDRRCRRRKGGVKNCKRTVSLLYLKMHRFHSFFGFAIALNRLFLKPHSCFVVLTRTTKLLLHNKVHLQRLSITSNAFYECLLSCRYSQ